MKNIISLKNFDLKKIPQKYHDGIIRLFYKLDIDGNEFIDDFIHSYISYAYEQSKKRSDVYLSTGFGRRYLENYLNKVKSKTKKLKKTNHKTLIAQLMEYAERQPDGIITIYGKHMSFSAAFNSIESYPNEITARSMLDKLVRVGVVERVDKKHIRFVTSLIATGLNDPDDIIRQLSDTLNRLCHTLLHNMDVERNDDGLTQISLWSDAIAPEDYQPCSDELRDEVRKCMKNCENILRKFEKKGLSKKTAEANNIELGISAFIFKNPK